MSDKTNREVTAPATWEVGVELAPFTRTGGLQAWNRYAGVNSEFVDIHMDDAAGQAAGLPGAVGMGNLLWAWMHCACDQWLGGSGHLAALECRFKQPALKGDVITCAGQVTAVETTADGGLTVSIDVWADNQNGIRIAPGRATVRVDPPRGSAPIGQLDQKESE